MLTILFVVVNSSVTRCKYRTLNTEYTYSEYLYEDESKVLIQN